MIYTQPNNILVDNPSSGGTPINTDEHKAGIPMRWWPFTRQKETTNGFGLRVKNGEIVYPEEHLGGQDGRKFGALIYTGDIDGEPTFLTASATANGETHFGPMDLSMLREIRDRLDTPVVAPEEEPPPVEPAEAAPMLPAVPSYFPSFLIDENSEGDLGLYLDHLKASGTSTRTVAEYLIDMRVWRRELAGALSVSRIGEVLDGFSPHRARRLLSVLSSYGKYRLFHNDHRLVVMLASQGVKRPKLSGKKRARLAGDQVKLYLTMAKSLCLENNRIGIWIGLSLMGVSASDIRHATPDGRNRVLLEKNGASRDVRCPEWLVRSMNEIRQSSWAVRRETIWKGVKPYGATPGVLCAAADGGAEGGGRDG